MAVVSTPAAFLAVATVVLAKNLPISVNHAFLDCYFKTLPVFLPALKDTTTTLETVFLAATPAYHAKLMIIHALAVLATISYSISLASINALNPLFLVVVPVACANLPVKLAYPSRYVLVAIQTISIQPTYMRVLAYLYVLMALIQTTLRSPVETAYIPVETVFLKVYALAASLATSTLLFPVANCVLAISSPTTQANNAKPVAQLSHIAKAVPLQPNASTAKPTIY